MDKGSDPGGCRQLQAEIDKKNLHGQHVLEFKKAASSKPQA